MDSQILYRTSAEECTDEDIVRRVLDGDVLLYELLMRRHNQRIYRAVRSILREDSETEDVMQETYVRAYEHLVQFEGRARFSTWLTRIAVNEAIRRANQRHKLDSFEGELGEREENAAMSTLQQNLQTPESNASRSEIVSMLESAILNLPETYRMVVMLRDIEEMSTTETAEALSLTESNVKVRLHRAHDLLRDELMTMVGAASAVAFEFHANRCDRVVHATLAAITGA